MDKFVRFGGWLGERLDANLENWLLPAPLANPGLTEMFKRRDRAPRESLMPWYGEFPGKYLTSAASAYACSGDPRLLHTCESLVKRIAEGQDEDGYVGPFPRDQRLDGRRAEGEPLWDLWGHYHIMLGLDEYLAVGGGALAKEVRDKAADYVAAELLSGRHSFEKADMPSMNLAVGHIYGRLYRETGKKAYYDMLRFTLDEMERFGQFFSGPLSGKQYFELPLPRWECLHAVQAMAEAWRIDGDVRARDAFFAIVDSIRARDRHNTGAFSSGEQACGDPFDPGAIETCCTVAWMALLTDALDLSGDARYADELELSLYNAMFGAQHPSGRWWTYDTPMDGFRRASAHTIVFQAYQGSPELNCCSVNGPRTLPLTRNWGAYEKDGAIALNYLGPARWRIGDAAFLVRDDYPLHPSVTIEAHTDVTLDVRVPGWSRAPGESAYRRVVLKADETYVLTLDFSLHAWPGRAACEGKTSLYRGPILLAFDQRFNEAEPDAMPAIDISALEPVEKPDFLSPKLLLRDPQTGAVLCDFASAGAVGSRYASWLSVRNPPKPRGGYAVL